MRHLPGMCLCVSFLRNTSLKRFVDNKNNSLSCIVGTFYEHCRYVTFHNFDPINHASVQAYVPRPSFSNPVPNALPNNVDGSTPMP